MCTTFTVLPQNGSERSYTVRNMDWPLDMKSEVWFVPRAHSAPVPALDSKGSYDERYELKRWTSRHAFFALNGLIEDLSGEPARIFNDGLNEAGLSVSALYLNEGCFECSPLDTIEKRENPPAKDSSIDIATLAEYLLGQFDTVEALVDCIESDDSGFPTVTVTARLLKELLGTLPQPSRVGEKWVYPCPLHYRVCDRAGHSAVLEWIDGMLHLYHDTKGAKSACNVMTNSPPYPWHLENLRWHAWLALSDQTYRATILPNGYEIKPGAANLGLNGLPSDLSSPTRFLRAAALSTLTSKRFAEKENFPNEEARINHLFSLAQILAIPRAYRHDLPPENNSSASSAETKDEPYDGRTLYSTVHDHAGTIFYVQSYERKLLLRFDFDHYEDQHAQPCCAIDDPELAPYWKEIVPEPSPVMG